MMVTISTLFVTHSAPSLATARVRALGMGAAAISKASVPPVRNA